MNGMQSFGIMSSSSGPKDTMNKSGSNVPHQPTDRSPGALSGSSEATGSIVSHEYSSSRAVMDERGCLISSNEQKMSDGSKQTISSTTSADNEAIHLVIQNNRIQAPNGNSTQHQSSSGVEKGSSLSNLTAIPPKTQDGIVGASVQGSGGHQNGHGHTSMSGGSMSTTHSPTASPPPSILTHQQQQQQQQRLHPDSRSPLHNPSINNVGNAAMPIPTDVAIDIDSILNSPRPKDEIVEKSPGGRYLRFSEKLGSGAYKDVYRAYDTSEGIEVAWNVVNLTGVPKGERQYIVNEVRLLEKLNHSNIISFHGSWVNRELEQVIFVTEILSSGTLKSFINKVQVIRYKIAKRWAIQILKGLEYMHSQDPPIVHRDLKCDNIFINGTSGDLRIGDLGLSTVISKKSKVLSVLGTPEFMAPELYDESYDQRVDIYAFGMCMLEIFTKELPYRECTNPAQIYKKVTMGVEPESLNRIRSSNARDFIRQCLGKWDENGSVTRPTASQLLMHPFLAKREDDDSQVEVLPPLRERTLSEVPNNNSGEKLPFEAVRTIYPDNESSPPNQIPIIVSSDVAPNRPPHISGHHGISTDISREQVGGQEIPILPPEASTMTLPPVPSQEVQQSTFDFDDMPDRESNMKPVKVLMGRGQELDTSNDQREMHASSNAVSLHASLQTVTTTVRTPQPNSIPSQYQMPQITRLRSDENIKMNGADSVISETASVTSHQNDSKLKYLRVAEIVEDDDGGAPFPNDMIELRLTLTVNHEDQHVQFRFHLIEDDPVQVAREMVTELNLPNDAVLEISETISGIARQSRVRQGQYKVLVQQRTAPNAVAPGTVSAVNFPNHTHVNKVQAYDNSLDKGKEELSPIYPTSVSTMAVGDAVLQQPGPDKVSQIHPQLRANGSTSVNVTNPSTNLLPTNRLTESAQPLNPQTHHHATAPSTFQATTQGLVDPLQSNLNSQSSSHNQLQRPISSNTLDTTVEVEHESDDEDELSNSSELKKLKIEHEKKKQRAQKAFHTRMENLQRSKEEKEAQHLQTLVKHEKEKAALAKRLKLAEREQHERLQKLEQEFVQQRAIAKKKVSSHSLLPNNTEEEAASNVLKNRISNMNLDSMNENTSTAVSGDAVRVQAPSPSLSDSSSKSENSR